MKCTETGEDIHPAHELFAASLSGTERGYALSHDVVSSIPDARRERIRRDQSHGGANIYRARFSTDRERAIFSSETFLFSVTQQSMEELLPRTLATMCGRS